jgi:hypothetical protein
MIRDHEFNTRWWGRPVGIVHDPAFFSLDRTTQRDLLKPYTWVEFYSQLDQAPPLQDIEISGFMQTDTQIRFLLNLRKVEATASSDRLDHNFADQQSFGIDAAQLAMFTHERFRHIPGCNAARTNERYALWANKLIEEHPDSCMQLFLDDRLQGWFLSSPESQTGLKLALAMLSDTAEISGMLLYQQACIAYAARGHRLGGASFSVTNTPVHNIYATLGARFLPPGGNWMWLAEKTGEAMNEATGKSTHD